MAAFTIFKNAETGKHVAVYDHQLPTQTGIGSNEKWVPVYHGQATDFLDKTRQRKEFEERSKEARRNTLLRNSAILPKENAKPLRIACKVTAI
jgi:hypothetical protein